MAAATRWGLVMFCVGVTCGTLGHYLPEFGAAVAVLIVSFLAAVIGAMANMDDWS